MDAVLALTRVAISQMTMGRHREEREANDGERETALHCNRLSHSIGLGVDAGAGGVRRGRTRTDGYGGANRRGCDGTYAYDSAGRDCGGSRTRGSHGPCCHHRSRSDPDRRASRDDRGSGTHGDGGSCHSSSAGPDRGAGGAYGNGATRTADAGAHAGNVRR